MNRRTVGAAFESEAASYLASRGFLILERNFRTRIGEIDLIAREPEADGSSLVFIEVKYRKSKEKGGGPLMAVGARKQRTIFLVAEQYLIRRRLPFDTRCRFDVIGITPDGIRHSRDAFRIHGGV